jgi:hypothetical protein
MDADFLKREAGRLMNDVVLDEALSRIRSQALERLAVAQPTDINEITRQQATVAVCDAMKAELSSMVRSAADRKPFRAV